MRVISDRISLKTRGEVDVVDVTTEVQSVVRGSKVENGILASRLWGLVMET